MPHERAGSPANGARSRSVEFAQQLLTSHPEEASHAFAPVVELLGRLLDDADAAGALRPGLDRQRITGVVLQATMFRTLSAGHDQRVATRFRRRGPLGSAGARHRRMMRFVRPQGEHSMTATIYVGE